MKIPAVAIAAAFAGGILLGLHGSGARGVVSPGLLVALVVICLSTLLLGVLFTSKNKLGLAGIVSCVAWIELGVLGGWTAQAPVPAEHVLKRVAAGTINLKSPLRWHGRLSSEPAKTPWGYSVEMALSGVEAGGELVPVQGGLRMGFTPREGDAELPEIHAGDVVTALTLAHLPLEYRDAGAFNRREYLANQGIDLVATLRSGKLLEVVERPRPRLSDRVSRWRARLRERVDELFPKAPQTASVLRAMLLGDRTFLEREESVDFQKTGVFHVLVVAGLHVGALALFLSWLFRRLRFSRVVATWLMLTLLFAYVMMVEQRTPVLRAGLMITIVMMGSYFYRRLELLNSAALAALLLLIAKPTYAKDSGFQLSFLAIGCIAGVAAPWIERHIQPYREALRGWRDNTRDVSYEARMVQFRLDVRSACGILTSVVRGKMAGWAEWGFVGAMGGWFWVAEMCVVSLVLQFGMLPLMARDFHRVPMMGPIANLVAVPLTGIIVPLGFLSLGASFVVIGIGKALAMPLGWLVGIQGHVVSGLAGMRVSGARVPVPPTGVMILFFGAAVLVAVGHRIGGRNRRWVMRGSVSAVVVAAALIVTYPFAPSVLAKNLEVTVLDVGQGDSILVVSPRGSALLIDGGGAFEGFPGRPEHMGADPGEEAVSAYLWSRGFKRLNAVAVTHAHQDHIGGLNAVLENFKVGEVWMGNANASPALAHFAKTAAGAHVAIKHELRGQSFAWDGVQVSFLWPEPVEDETAPVAKNNDSLVVRLKYGERTILLTGDAEKQAEYTMLDENDAAALHADVLKVGHHGSKNSTMPEFLAAVGPQIGIISSGEQNPYGHPSPELLERLKEAGIRTLRTDEQGAIQVLTDGHDLRVSCYVACGEPENSSARAQLPDHSESEKK